MANIYSAPEEIALPRWDFSKPVKDYRDAEQKYITDLRDFIKERFGDGECVGEVIKFPVADGHALYMVLSLKPVALIHLKLGDMWEFEYAHRLTKKDVVDKVNQEKNLRRLFGG